MKRLNSPFNTLVGPPILARADFEYKWLLMSQASGATPKRTRAYSVDPATGREKFAGYVSWPIIQDRTAFLAKFGKFGRIRLTTNYASDEMSP